MNLFQLVGLPLAALAVLATLVAAGRHRISTRAAAGWGVLWILAALAIADPELTMVVARVLGIGRGADLVFYCAILGMIVGFFLMYVRYRKVQEEITVLVREIAILRAVEAEREKGEDRG